MRRFVDADVCRNRWTAVVRSGKCSYYQGAKAIVTSWYNWHTGSAKLWCFMAQWPCRLHRRVFDFWLLVWGPPLSNIKVSLSLSLCELIGRTWSAWETWSSTIRRSKPGLLWCAMLVEQHISSLSPNGWGIEFRVLLQCFWIWWRMGCHSNENNLFYTQKAARIWLFGGWLELKQILTIPCFFFLKAACTV